MYRKSQGRYSIGKNDFHTLAHFYRRFSCRQDATYFARNLCSESSQHGFAPFNSINFQSIQETLLCTSKASHVATFNIMDKLYFRSGAGKKMAQHLWADILRPSELNATNWTDVAIEKLTDWSDTNRFRSYSNMVNLSAFDQMNGRTPCIRRVIQRKRGSAGQRQGPTQMSGIKRFFHSICLHDNRRVSLLKLFILFIVFFCFIVCYTAS